MTAIADVFMRRRMSSLIERLELLLHNMRVAILQRLSNNFVIGRVFIDNGLELIVVDKL